MTRTPRRLLDLLAVAAVVGATATPAHALTVFDPANYQQNLISAIRALDQVRNQIRQLENEALQLRQAERHLQPLSGNLGAELTEKLAALRGRIAEGGALALSVRETEAGYARLYPAQFPATVATDEAIRTARAQWDESYASFRRAALIQGHVSDAGAADARLLDQIVARSAGAVGGLQATQAANELTALHVKQSLQIQALQVAQARAETAERARILVAQEQARAATRAFLADGRAYTRAP